MSSEDRYMEEGEVIFRTDNYRVEIGMFRLGEWEGKRGYLIINNRTGVAEGEVNVEAVAIRATKDMDEELTRVLSGEDDEIDVNDPDAVVNYLDNR